MVNDHKFHSQNNLTIRSAATYYYYCYMVFHENGICNNHDDAPVVWTNGAKDRVETTTNLQRRKKKVQFNLADTRFMLPTTTEENEEDGSCLRSELWYTPQDFAEFQHQARLETARLIQQAREESTSMPNAWMRLYFALRQAHTKDQVRCICESSAAPTTVLEEPLWGLYQQLDPIQSDYRIRRQHLIEQLGRLQYTYSNQTHQRDVIMQKASVLNSHASRIYAAMAARAVQAALEEKET